MPERSAGLLVYRRSGASVQFLLAHPGGPFWAKKDDGAWSIPKGLIGQGEESFAAAAREFEEEVGQPVAGAFAELTPVKQKGGKVVLAWMVEADLDLGGFRSNHFEIEWPPRSGRRASFPEIDRVGWFDPSAALSKILPSQAPLILEALARLSLPAASAGAPSNERRLG
jgi:predicted NUDIX family NTP pyrophosphohydrolase